eukprot:364604-Chlamydomonas_euryale.AAC.20
MGVGRHAEALPRLWRPRRSRWGPASSLETQAKSLGHGATRRTRAVGHCATGSTPWYRAPRSTPWYHTTQGDNLAPHNPGRQPVALDTRMSHCLLTRMQLQQAGTTAHRLHP